MLTACSEEMREVQVRIAELGVGRRKTAYGGRKSDEE